MNEIFTNTNGNNYYILFGTKESRAFLCNLDKNNSVPFVICAILEENSWWQGSYFEDFDEAYKYWKEK